jgi:hypothetical protein
MSMATNRRFLRQVFGAALLTAAAWMGAPGEAHKAITSKYTYNDDVFPILRDRCSRCHVPGGVAPMSLMTYDDAFPWAESIRAELIAAHMPPWNADESFGEVKRAHTLSAKELDIVLTWATGGNPRGAIDQNLPAVTMKNEWPLGKPDVALPLPAEFTLAADKMEETRDFTIPTGLTEPRWVRAVDLLPGTPSIVRSALVYVKNQQAPASAVAPEPVLARWLPGQDPEPMSEAAAMRLPANAELGVRIHYKKTWQFEGKPMTDRSTVGIYFAPVQMAQELLAIPIASEQAPARSKCRRTSRCRSKRFARTDRARRCCASTRAPTGTGATGSSARSHCRAALGCRSPRR